MSTETQQQVCRLCDESNDKMLNIFEKNFEGIQIINLIKKCLPIVIYRTDPLSKFVCNSCTDTLSMFYELRKTSMDLEKRNCEELQLQKDNRKIDLFLAVINEQATTPDFNNLNDLSTQDVSTMTEFECFNKTSDDASVFSQNSVPMNNETDSDMDLDEIGNESVIHEQETEEFRIQMEIDAPLTVEKRKRIMGPKSKTRPYLDVEFEKTYFKRPLTLEECVIHFLNKQNVPNYNKVPYEIVEQVTEHPHYFCAYCEDSFGSEDKLAIHEMTVHIQLQMRRVDEDVMWKNDSHDTYLRNKWYESTQDSGTNPEDSAAEEDSNKSDNSLLVPLVPDEGTLDTSRKSRFSFINGVAHMDGKPFSMVSKVLRYGVYPNVLFNGRRRKFCNLCRYTFKDNWSIESHYSNAACCYTCHYCGIKFAKNRNDFFDHVESHVRDGHTKTLDVLVNNLRLGGPPKRYPVSTLKPYVSTNLRRISSHIRIESNVEPEPPLPPREMTRRPLPPMVPIDRKPLTTADTTKSQAYFCKKCYKVFPKLDEFKIHNASCTGEVTDPEMNVIRHYNKKDGSSPIFCSKVKQQPRTYQVKPIRPILPKPQSKPQTYSPLPMNVKIKQEPTDDVNVSNTGRPLRHCVREVGTYREEERSIPDFEEPLRKSNNEKAIIRKPAGESPSNQCPICLVVFSNYSSRNSHMRVHKNAETTFKRKANDSPNGLPAKKLRQQSYEPIVEIHEGTGKKVPATVASVSITPLKKKEVDSDIMDLVRNNPSITIKPRGGSTPVVKEVNSVAKIEKEEEEEEPPPDNGPKRFKCSGCSKPFANKSNLYFHKKNNCTGSRFPCPFCKKRFGKESEYSAHIFYSHPD